MKNSLKKFPNTALTTNGGANPAMEFCEVNLTTAKYPRFYSHIDTAADSCLAGVKFSNSSDHWDRHFSTTNRGPEPSKEDTARN